MIINRYLQRNIYLGTLGALVVLVSLSLFFIFVGELEDLGQGDYRLARAIEYVALKAPGKLVEFMPLAALLGSMLSLGALAGNSEIIAMQASGVSLPRLLASVVQAGLVLALITWLVADWIVPASETGAKRIKNRVQEETSVLNSQQGIWIKDESRVVHIGSLLPNGYARDVEIFELDAQDRLLEVLRAASAVPLDRGWELHQVERSIIGGDEIGSERLDRLVYRGNLSRDLLQVFMTEPRWMSSFDLHAYLNFLDENRLDGRVERLIYWQKLFAPLTIVIMCLLALPFVLGAQRQSNVGQRLLVGILLGLAFVVVDRLLTQLGNQFALNALLTAMLPNLVFLSVAIYLLITKQSHAVGVASRVPVKR